MTDRWYFAYGSNLWVDQKEERTGVIREAVRCRLTGHRIAFNKRPDRGDAAYANIVPDDSAEVWGIAYLCDDAAIRALNGYEGVLGGHYRHEDVEVLTDTGEVLPALTYVAGDGHECEERVPESAYLNKILDGARYHQLPDDYIEMLKVLGGGPAG